MTHTSEKKELTERARKLKEYYWKCFLSEFSKVCIFLIIFIFLDLTTEYIFALLYLMLLRSNGGGLHFKHYTSCLLVSFSFIYSSILLALHTSPTFFCMLLSLLLCALLGYSLVPVTSSNRPKATLAQTKKCKRNTILLILTFILLICFCPHNTYLYIGYWTIILHILQLAISRIQKEVKHHVRLGISF